MLQRIQTVWLVLAALVCGGAAYLSGFVPGVADWMAPATSGVFAAAAVVVAVAIFLYGNRNRQRTSIIGAQYLILLGLGLLILAMVQLGVSAAIAALTRTSWGGACGAGWRVRHDVSGSPGC